MGRGGGGGLPSRLREYAGGSFRMCVFTCWGGNPPLGEYTAHPASKSMFRPSIPMLYPQTYSLLQPRLPNPAVSGAHVWAEWRHHPCLLEGPQHRDKTWGENGDNWRIGEKARLCPARPAC